MKKSISIIIVLCLAALSGSAQYNRPFRKIVKNKYTGMQQMIPNGKIENRDNTSNKQEIETALFRKSGSLYLDKNGLVDFSVAPAFAGAYGFRLVRDSTDTGYMLEVKRINNFNEANKQADERFPTIGIPAKILSDMPENIDSLIRIHNSVMYPRGESERLKLYTTETISIPVSDRFAEKLHDAFVSFIGHFKAGEIAPQGVSGDNDAVAFHTIADKEIWTLEFFAPLEGNVLEMSDLCKQIIADAKAGRFDEAKVLKQLKQ